MRRLSDDELGVLAAAGEHRAFALIFERYHQPLYRYCLGIVRDTELAADALQNTMIAALRGLEASERPIALRPWLYRIAHNQSVSLMRRTRVTTSVDTLIAVPGGVDPSVRERLQELVRDLQSLPDQQRSALLLRELNGLDYEEVALALAISENGARQAVFKARQALHTTVAGRTERCETVQASMSSHDRRFQRRRDIRAHLDDCPDCTAFAAALVSRPADLPLLFPALPAAAAAGMLADVAPSDDDEDRRRRGGVLFLLLGLALASAAVALAASGVFSSGDGGGGSAKRSAAATPREAPPAPSPSARHHRRPSRHHHRPGGSEASSAGGNAALEPASSAGRPSAQSGYATPGALTETAVSGGCASASSNGGGSDGAGAGEGGAGSGGSASSGSGGGSSRSTDASGCAGSGGGGLPLTGLALVALLASALALLSGGFALRRIST